ncbi:hypothetical protein A0R60_4097 [Enterobacter asburiae]|nr:hypothetical protein A0R60_2826 [Enterobacter asburiae]AMX08321.1 hypothetical protein A0R60_4097 [Enterobacter asburiae]
MKRLSIPNYLIFFKECFYYRREKRYENENYNTYKKTSNPKCF